MLIQTAAVRNSPRKSCNIRELLDGGSARLTSLRDKSRHRSTVLAQVRALLSPPLARAVASAGIDAGRLTIGVSSAAWASRLRYQCTELSQKVGEAIGVEILSVRVRVVHPNT